MGNKVYVHCRAGHGRSAAVVFLWMIYKDPIVDLQVLNKQMCTLRNVRKSLYKQPNILKLHQRLLQTGSLIKSKSSSSSNDRKEKDNDERDEVVEPPPNMNRILDDDDDISDGSIVDDDRDDL